MRLKNCGASIGETGRHVDKGNQDPEFASASGLPPRTEEAVGRLQISEGIRATHSLGGGYAGQSV